MTDDKNFAHAFAQVIGHEGGYVNHPDDPGGETKFGVSKRAYPDEDIANLTLERAKELYYRDYWEKLPALTDYPHLKERMFDFAINSGPKRAIKTLQKVLDVTADGIWGAKSQEALYGSMCTGREIAVRLLTERLRFMTKLDNWESFSKGWTRRIAHEVDDLFKR